ncbi:MAG: threonine--tRNA ligase [Acidobacteriota bacterium]
MSTTETLLEVIHRDGRIEPVSDKDEALEILRHSTSHLMALAVMDLFPDVRLGIGPATSEGFYYDFQTDHRFTDEDLQRIEARMRELQSQDLPYEPSIISREEALEFFSERGEKLKTELIAEREKEILSCYRLGKLIDFCLGPHVRSTGRLGVFKLLSVAGSYWKGDEHREQLQRIYGTAFFTQEELDRFLARIEEARRRDHRRLGRELGLFTIEESVAPGLIFWHPQGAVVRGIIEAYLREELTAGGYQFVYTPHIAKSDLWKVSGHYDYFRQNMYTLPVDEEEYVLKPMNCPGHILVYKSDVRSYRDLPIRLAEFGTVYRYEKSGTLHGTLRVRGFTQDDAHIFCRPDQVKDEVVATLNLAQKILRCFGFEDFKVTLSVWDPARAQDYAGRPEDWGMAESVLVEVLREMGWDYTRAEGEAAFYGPKIDVQLIDALGRAWQLSTFQFDFNLPARFNVTFVGADSKPHHVVMVHRALLGSLERFFGVLIEHYGGAFPLWLAPVQAVVIPISEKHHDYARQVEAALKTAGLRVACDVRNEKVGYKIRDHQLKKVPYMLVVGDREAESGTVSVRSRSEGDLGPRPVPELAAELKKTVDQRAIKP